MQQALEKRGMRVDREGPLLVVHLHDKYDGSQNQRPTDVLFAVAAEEGLQVRHLSPRKLTLENAFVRAVNEAKAS
jgi:hypothetical protein